MGEFVRNGDLSLKQRIDLLKKCLIIGGAEILNEQSLENSFYRFHIGLNGKEITCDFLIKNISNSGWKEKPEIKRIQVKKMGMYEITKNTNKTCSLFVGVCFVNENPVFVAWNPFMYIYHNTNRSCYINVDLLERVYEEGLFKTLSSNQRVLLTDTKHFVEMIELFIELNEVEEL